MSKMSKRIETIIKLGIFSAAVMYGINKIIESTALTRNILNMSGGDYFRWSHGSVFYKKAGHGSPVLLIHDLDPSSSMFEWSQVASTLAIDHTVYMIDLPGCGRSTKMSNQSYINYLYVRLLKEFIDEVIKEKTSVIATGISGSFVIMAASIHEGIIDKITLVNPKHPDTLSSGVTMKSKIVKALLDAPILGTFLYNMEYSNQQIEYRFTELLFHNPFTVTSKLIHTYYESAHIHRSKGKHLLASLQSNFMNVNIGRTFTGLKQDVTIVIGKSMPNASSIAEAYQKMKPDVKTIFISKAKMLPQLEEPGKFLHYIQ